jgi:hypothetical protein
MKRIFNLLGFIAIMGFFALNLTGCDPDGVYHVKVTNENTNPIVYLDTGWDRFEDINITIGQTKTFTVRYGGPAQMVEFEIRYGTSHTIRKVNKEVGVGKTIQLTLGSDGVLR